MAVYSDIAASDPLRSLKEVVNREEAEHMEAIRCHWKAHPEAKEAWLSSVRAKNREDAIAGWQGGRWDLDDDHNPIPPRKHIRISDLPPNAVMAHVLHAAGVFRSIGEAKRNGWDKPIELGDLTTKRNLRIRVTE